MARRVFLAVALSLSGCAPSVPSPPAAPAREVGQTMIVYADGSSRAVGRLSVVGETDFPRVVIPIGTPVQWMGEGYVIDKGVPAMDRAIVRGGELRGETVFFHKHNLRPLPQSSSGGRDAK